MTAAVVTLVLLTAGTYALKAAGPVLLGRRTVPPVVARAASTRRPRCSPRWW